MKKFWFITELLGWALGTVLIFCFWSPALISSSSNLNVALGFILFISYGVAIYLRFTDY